MPWRLYELLLAAVVPGDHVHVGGNMAVEHHRQTSAATCISRPMLLCPAYTCCVSRSGGRHTLPSTLLFQARQKVKLLKLLVSALLL